MKYNIMKKKNKKKTEFIISASGKKEFTKSKNEIKENLLQKICPPTFCTNSYIPLTIVLMKKNSNL